MSGGPHAGDGLASVTISRTSSQDVRERQVVVRVDDEPKVTMYFGEQVTLDLSPGEHRLRVHNTLVWKTVDFRLEPGQSVEFAIVNYSPRITLGLLAVLGAGPLFLRIEQRTLATASDGTDPED